MLIGLGRIAKMYKFHGSRFVFHEKGMLIISLTCTFLFRVTAEPGVKLSNLISILETVNMTLELSGPLPDLALVDAIAIGLTGTYWK